jgi:hypothetical protein
VSGLDVAQGVAGVAEEAQDASAGHWWAAWDSALRAVELDVEDAERLILRMHAGGDDVAPAPVVEDWVVPALLGPLPSEFADRARRLLRRQAEVSERLAEAMVHARSQRRALGKFDQAERRPVFVDTAV